MEGGEGSKTDELHSAQPKFTHIIQKYSDVFAHPLGMPPHRERDHFIYLEPGSKPINVRPYRYPQFQKEIEWLVAKMLDQKVIKHGSSPFSSSMLLVKKKVGDTDCVLIIEP